MHLSNELRQFLIDVSEQVRMDGIAIKLAYKIVRNQDKDLADMLEIVQFKAEATWNEILKLLG